jgi:uncharacterized protein (DUF362 family)
MDVFVERCATYDDAAIDGALARWERIFATRIRPGHSVTIKPNWITASHKYDRSQWEGVITHPAVITAVLRVVLKCLDGRGRVVIADSPQTQASWSEIMSRMTPERWVEMGARAGVDVAILDLRDHEWVTRNDVIVHRRTLTGDPLGSTECDLAGFSEFVDSRPGRKGYFGADYDLQETNAVHSNGYHKYRVSRSVIASDVFINLPKMKTHKKAGITCSLKNLVGINTYKNWLPHHTEGTPDEGGDQFPQPSWKARLEGQLMDSFRRILTRHERLGSVLAPVKSVGRSVFGDTRDVIRSGNWHGNQTLWRMVLDLNKILLYANPDGTLRSSEAASCKPYISVVDGIVAGEGNGPEAPDSKHAGLLVAGTSPVAVDAVCAKLMGFDWRKIPSIANAVRVRHFPICRFAYEDIGVVSSVPELNRPIADIPPAVASQFKPHFGWLGHIEA